MLAYHTYAIPLPIKMQSLRAAISKVLAHQPFNAPWDAKLG